MKTVMLREVAHTRTGEKINTLNLAVIAYNEEDYYILKEQVTVDRIIGIYGPIAKGYVIRYECPNISSLNFVFHNILEGGRTMTISFEESGKSLSSLALMLEVQVPDNYVTRKEYMSLNNIKEGFM